MRYSFADAVMIPIILALLFYGAYYTWDWRHDLSGDWFIIPYIFAVFAFFVALKLIGLILFLIIQGIRYIFVFRIKGHKGTAGFANKKQMRCAKAFKKRGFFIGKAYGKAVYADTESSGLVLSPAGGGKGTTFVIPNLMHVRDSMVVVDLKAVLAVMTAKYRKRKLKHGIITVNPFKKHLKQLGKPSRYNPLIILMTDWKNPDLHGFLLPDARSIAKQLIPEPAYAGENQYWRNGARKCLVVVFIYMVILENTATLSNGYTLLCNVVKLKAALLKCAASTALCGDVSSLANDLLTKFEDADQKQIESFREGAIQALEEFAPSSALAESTSACDFSFADLKKKKVTLYLIGDPTRAKASESWTGLLAWCAITEMLRFWRWQARCHDL